MTFISTLFAVAIFVMVPINWWASWQLWQLSKENPTVRTLRERAVAAVTLSIAITIFAVMTVLVTLDIVELDVVTIVRRASVILLTLPAFYWFWLARRG